MVTLVRESETTIKIKFSLFRGGLGRGAGRKIVQNTIFHGKRHDNKILKVKSLLSRNFVVMAQGRRLLLGAPPHLALFWCLFFFLGGVWGFGKFRLRCGGEGPPHLYLLSFLGCTPKGAYSSRGRSRHLLETAFSEPLLRTLLRTLFYCKTHRRPPSQNPSENLFPRTPPRTFSEPFSERCVAVRPLRRAPHFLVVDVDF